MGPNRMITFQFEGFRDYTFDELPKGKCVEFGVNPYTGNVVFSFQDSGTHPEVALRVMEQVVKDSLALRMCGDGFGLSLLADYCEGKLVVDEELPQVVRGFKCLGDSPHGNSGFVVVKAS